MRSLRPRPARLRLLTISLVLVGAGASCASTAQAAVSFSPWPASPFERPVAEVPQAPSMGLQPVDLNDGTSPDLALTFTETNGSSTFPGPSFGPRGFVPTYVSYPRGTASADVDGDGRRDLFVWGDADKGGGPIDLQRGTASGLVATGGTPYARPILDAALADFSGDGKLDLFAAEADAVSVRAGKPGPVFSTSPADGAASSAIGGTIRVSAGDVTGDGKADLLFAHPSQDGEIGIRTAPALAAAGLAVSVGSIQDLFLANVSGDARPEAVVLTASEVKVYPVTNTGQFGTPVVTATGARITPKQSAVADLDADGDGDVVLATTAQDRVIVMQSNGNGTFAAPQPVSLPGGARRGAVDAITAADFDADGDADLAVASDGGYRVDVLINGVALPPSVATLEATGLGYETATLTGTANLRGIGGTVRFEYGETTDYGTTTDLQVFTPTPSAVQPVTAAITGLKPSTTYHARLVATNGGGTVGAADITFTTTAAPAADQAVAITASKDTVVSGAPVGFSADATGSFGPYRYSWDFGDATAADGPTATHAFAAQRLSQADLDIVNAAAAKTADPNDGAVDGGLRRGSYTVTVTATDRFGRQVSAKRPVTVVPNDAPTVALSPLVPVLEYTTWNFFDAHGSDPNQPIDRVVREEWSFDGTPGTTVDSKAPIKLRPLTVPFLNDLGGRKAINGLDLFGGQPTARYEGEPDSIYVPRREALMSAAASALDLYPSAIGCPGRATEMSGCWPNPSSTKVRVRAVDSGGLDVVQEREIPIRVRARPASSMKLINPDAKTTTSGQASANSEIAAPITTGTELRFDPGATTVDGDESPEYYVLQVGKPWQLRCAGVADSVKPANLGDPVANERILQAPGKAPPIIDRPGNVGPEVTNQLNFGFGSSGRGSFSARALASRQQTTALPTKGSTKDKLSSASNPRCAKDAQFGVGPSIATVVSRSASDLRLKIPQLGAWSVLLTVYDRIGGRSRERIDGLVIQAEKLDCQPLGRGIGKPRKGWFNVTGTCVSGDQTKDFQWTPNAVDVNGVRIAPAPGDYLVLDGGRDADPSKNVKAVPPSIYSAEKAPSSSGSPMGKRRPVSIIVGNQAIANVELARPGENSTAAQPRFNGDLDTLTLTGAKDATYGGLPIKTVGVNLARACGPPGGTTAKGSNLRLVLLLPTAFSIKDALPTRDIDVLGCNGGKASITTTSQNDSGKPARATKAAASSAEKAKRLLDPGPVSMSMDNIELGPITFGKLDLSYDPATKTFRGKGSGVLLTKEVEITLVITDGRLVTASGKVGVEMPIGNTPIKLKSIEFGVQTEPVFALVGTAVLSTIDPSEIVTGTGTITFQPDPFVITLDGTAGLLKNTIPLAKAKIQIGNGLVSIESTVHYGSGPIYFDVTTKGAFSQNAFNVEGSGSACVFVCLGVNGVVSSTGAAVCGEIDLWVATWTPGIGVKWSPFDFDAYADGCNIAPYRATNFLIDGKPAPLPPGGAMPFDVEKDQKTLSVSAKSGTAGIPPTVTLMSPSGKAYVTPAIPAGDGQVVDAGGSGALVDMDRSSGETRFVIGTPEPGRWSLKADSGIADVDFGREYALPTAADFQAKAAPLPETEKVPADLFGGFVDATTAQKYRVPDYVVTRKIKAESKSIPTSRKRNPKAKKTALQGVAVPTAVPIGNPIKLADIGPQYRKLITTAQINVDDLISGDKVELVESGVGTTQSLASFEVPPSGKIDSRFAFIPGVSGPRNRQIDAYISSPSGVPRGVVKNITSFKADTPPAPAAPKIFGAIKAKGKTISFLTKSAPAYGKKSDATQFVAVVKSRTGDVTVKRIAGRDFKKSGNAWSVSVKLPVAAKGSTLTIKPLGATGTVLKGKSKTLKAR